MPRTGKRFMTRALAILAVMAASPFALAQIIEIQTATRDVWPFFDTRQRPATGLCTDLLHAIEAEDPGLRFIGLDRKLSVPLLESAFSSGKITVLCPMARSPERDKMAIDAGVVALGRLALGVRRNDTVPVTDLTSLVRESQAQPVLARKGSVLAKTLRAAGVKVSDDALDNRAMAHMVARGRARYFYSFDYIIAHTIRSEQLENELTLIQPELGGESLHLLVSRQLPENVARRIIGAFARIEARGDYARLLAQYALSNKPGKK